MRFLSLVICLYCSSAYAQATMPLLSDDGRIGEMLVGQKVQVYKEALVVDYRGRAWLDKNYIYDTSFSRYKELQVLKLKSGYAVTVLYGWKDIRGYKVRTYPSWRRSYVDYATHLPVKILGIKSPPETPAREITFPIKKAKYASPGSSNY